MQTIDDDHTCTQLAAGWLYIAAGGEKYQVSVLSVCWPLFLNVDASLQEAHSIFHELCDKFAPVRTPTDVGFAY